MLAEELGTVGLEGHWSWPITAKRADLLAEAAVANMKRLSAKVKTISFDNGLELAEHEKIGAELAADIYFADPNASWERGTNENTNGLIRQYFPKGTDFNQCSDEQVKFAIKRLKNRPIRTKVGRSTDELSMRRE